MTGMDWTPAEYAQAAGVANGHDVMKLAAQLDATLPRICLCLAQDYLTGSTFWALKREGRIIKRFGFRGKTAQTDALQDAQAFAARRYDVHEWGKVTNAGRGSLFPAAVAAAVTETLRTARKNNIEPSALREQYGL